MSGGRRWWQRRLVWAGAGVIACAAVTLYGWRYGFSALPEAVSDPTPDPMGLWAAPVLGTNNFWYHVRAAHRDLRTLHADPGSLADPFSEFEAAGQRVRRHFEAAVAAPDRRPPPDLGPEDVFSVRALAGEVRVLALELGQEGDGPGALRHLLALWQFEAALVPSTEFTAFFDERGVAYVEAVVVHPFRDLVWNGPPVPFAEGLRLLRELTAVPHRLAPPDHAFARQMLRDANYQRTLSVPDWARVTRSFQMAALLVRQDVGRFVTDVLERILGRRQGGEPNYHAAAHVLRPLGHLVVALQTWVARPGDFARLRDASVSRTRAALRTGTLPPPNPPVPWLPGNARARSGWRSSWDRPAVWRSIEALPDPRAALHSRQQWLEYLDVCRLTLAQRLFKDRYGRVPEQLEELVPEFLEAVPLNPGSGAPRPAGRGVEDGRRGLAPSPR